MSRSRFLSDGEAKQLDEDFSLMLFNFLRGKTPMAMSSDGPYPLPENVQVAVDEVNKAIAEASALDVQVAGNHYKSLPIQPVQYIHANKIGYFEGNVIKYVTRWKEKGGIADLEKAAHYIQLLIELEKGEQPKQAK